MSDVRLRVWANGASTVTMRAQNSSVSHVLEFDGRGRYHAIAILGKHWSDTEFRLNMARHAGGFFFKRSSSQHSGGILTHWQAHSATRVASSGKTLLHADNTVRWSQQTRLRGFTTTAEGDGSASTRLVEDADGIPQSRSTMQSFSPNDLGSDQTVTTQGDGGTTSSVTQTKVAADGGKVSRTLTTQTDASGQVTSQTVSVTKQNVDGSTTTRTTSTDNGSGIATDTGTQTDGTQSISQSTVTDTNTGATVSTTNSTGQFTDSQGNTVTTNGASVSSSDGFSSSLVTVTSSDGSSGYTSQTSDGQGNSQFTNSSTDASGNTQTQTNQTDAKGNTTVTTTSTDSNGDGTQTTETYASDGTQTSSSTSSVSGDGSNSGPGGGAGSGSGSGSTQDEVDPDDGLDDGPRSPTGRVSMGLGTTDPGNGDGGDFGGEGDARNEGIGRYLQGYSDATDENGWGDGSFENSPWAPQVDIVLQVPLATDDWDNLNNPRALTGLLQLLLVGAALSSQGAVASGVSLSRAANGAIGSRISVLMGIPTDDGGPI